MGEVISINLRFLEPYRVLDFRDARNNPGFMRGGSFACWKQRNGGSGWRLFITGTLLRSATIRAAEGILGLTGGKINWNGKEISCCNGKFGPDGRAREPKYLRKRPAYKWSDKKEVCQETEPCPFCYLLGRFDESSRDEKNPDRYHFHFGNLELAGERSFDRDFIDQIATKRSLNRVDFETGKAHDYFKILEIEDQRFWHYKGKITISDGLISSAAEKLLIDSIRFIDQLCGGICVIEIQSTNVAHEPETVRYDIVDTNGIEKRAGEIAASINELFSRTGKLDKLRIVADAIRGMRLKGIDGVRNLPAGKDGRGHYIWDKIEWEGKSLRKILQDCIEEEPIKNNWRKFIESLGQHLYEYSQKVSGTILKTRIRMLGDAEYYSSQGRAGKVVRIDSGETLKEWVFLGKLRAETPFYFGTIIEQTGQTSLPILLEKSGGRFRIPRSVLRGALRRHLRHALGTGCDVELGPDSPCNCPVCMLMRDLIVLDAKSDDYGNPPEIRHRIRRNHFLGTVDEGALFDMELGPEGITFPFILRYRGSRLKQELADVMGDWAEGKAFLGGAGATGKGRFSLVDLKVLEIDLKCSLNKYIENHGFRGAIKKEIKIKEIEHELTNIGFSNIQLPRSPNYKPQWERVDYEIEIRSPLLSNDPIEALFDPENHDSVPYKKLVWKEGGISENYVIKGESIRGLFRTALGRILTYKENDTEHHLFELDHEDCSCLLCTIFGSEHEAGKIRFEDLIIDGEICEKHLDHVAIDRFTSGAEDKKKYDDFSLAGSPDKPLVLRGTFWIKASLQKEDREKIAGALRNALCDIREGLYPVGSRGGIGYGWISDVRITAGPPDLLLPDRSKVGREMSPKKPDAPFGFPELPALEIGNDKIYSPHYFLVPHRKVYRDWKEKLTGHEKFNPELLTGKIECTLKTLTPLIVPDTEAAIEDAAGHRTYPFFRIPRINGEVMIPGSEIRGMVSSFYEALTNSCFRIFDEDLYLSRRIKPAQRNILSAYVPGRIKTEGDRVFIEKLAEEFRLPLYDDLNVTESFKVDLSKIEDDQRKQRIKLALESNRKIAEIAEHNRNFLLNLSEDFRMLVLSGKKSVHFEVIDINKENPKDKLAKLTDDTTKKEGYIKFTGLNMVNVKDWNKLDENFNTAWDVWCLNILLTNSEPWWRPSLKRKYPRPCLRFIKDGKEYMIPKRCERIFTCPNNNSSEYEVPLKVQTQYRQILKDYEKNFGHIHEKFKTLVQNCELEDGNLVYFVPNNRNRTVEAIAPVRISRRTDTRPLGKRMPYGSDDLRPCERDVLEDGIDRAFLNNLPDKSLFMIHPDGLCPACRLFGTTHYKGRVRFGFARAEKPVKWLIDDGTCGGYITLPLLERPRPTWSMPGEASNVPGRKFYVHHNGWKAIKEGTLKEKKTKNNCSVEAVDVGNKFRFEVFFENLAPWELGLLIYSLELENGLAHKMGMAKPLGFGSVKLCIEKILLRNSPDNWQIATSDNKKEWLNQGFAKLASWFDNTSWHEAEHIKELRSLLQVPKIEPVNVRYPILDNNNPGEPPGYVQLDREPEGRDYLTKPWHPWHPVSE